MSRWIWISSLSALGLLVVGLLAATPLAESRAKAEARERGLVLEMDDFRLGWFRAEIDGATIRLEGVDEVEVSVQQLVVDFGLGAPRIQRITAEDGVVEIHGTVDEISSALKKWHGARPRSRATPKDEPGARREEALRDFSVRWKNAFGAGKQQVVSGLSAQRGAGGLHVGADLVELRRGEWQVQLAGAQIKAKTAGLDLSQAQHLGAAEMRVTYDASSTDPERKKAAPPDAPPSPPAPAATDAAPSSTSTDAGLKDRLERDADRVAKLTVGLDLLRKRILPRLPPSAKVEKTWITYQRQGERLHVGPSVLSLSKKKSSTEIGITPRGKTEGTPLSLRLIVHPKSAEHALTLELKGGPVSLGTLGVAEGAFGLSGVDHTALSGSVAANLSQDAKEVSGGGKLFIEGLAIDSPKLSERLVTFPKLAFFAEAEMRVDGSYYKLEDASLRMGETRFVGSLEMERGADFVTFEANAKAPLVSCQALLDSAPRGLLGAAEHMRFEGTFSLDAGVKADTRELANMVVRWDFENGCKVRAVPADLDPEQFRTLFRREVIGAGNFPVELEFGPFSTSWVPLDEVSPYVEKALLVTEDGRFYRHDGFDDRAIESAILDNVRQGRFVRGASTISMQLAKNLYLSRKKTLARKFQEAALTTLLEQSFDKSELLELYINVIEFGPGIYGIRQAAEHYFGTHPGRLTAAQAFFLASILPAPTRQYFESDGSLKDSRRAYVHRLLQISHGRDAITEGELEDALEEELLLGRAETRPPDENEGSNEGDERRSTWTDGKEPRKVVPGGVLGGGTQPRRKTAPHSGDVPHSPPPRQPEAAAGMPGEGQPL